MPPSPTRSLPLRGQIELNPRTINAPESPHDVLRLQGTPFGETIGLPEPLAGSGHHKVTPGAACICRLRPPGFCRRLPAPTTTYGLHTHERAHHCRYRAAAAQFGRARRGHGPRSRALVAGWGAARISGSVGACPSRGCGVQWQRARRQVHRNARGLRRGCRHVARRPEAERPSLQRRGREQPAAEPRPPPGPAHAALIHPVAAAGKVFVG